MGQADDTPIGPWESWGRVVKAPHRRYALHHRDDAPGLIAKAASGHSVLPVGLGRSYGDSNLNAHEAILEMSALDRLMAFDPETGILRAEAGVSLWDILDFAVPRGFFLPTTPGTRFVTLGGAIANDVHGKNHHRAGTFGRWVRRIGLQRSDTGYQELSPSDPLFTATIAGLGLTGVILWADLELVRVPSSQIDQEVIPFGGLDEFFTLNRESEESHEHTVAWIDCVATGEGLGRGLFTRGNWAQDGEYTVCPQNSLVTMPMDAPGFVLNKLSLTAFNKLYYANGKRKAGRSTVPYGGFFYPLDAINSWNRLYGQRGFYQYQSVIPPAAAEDATREMLEAIAAAGQGSFLAVLKTFGDLKSPGLLSFPREGTTLALDFPNKGWRTLALLDRLDAIVSAAGGRLYPAKDGRLHPAQFREGYPALGDFLPHRDPAISSAFWKRMNIE